MSGHSKWSKTKHIKGAQDAKRGKIFTKLIREITVAARTGGGNPEGNARLRTAILKAKENNMPQDNIKRAIQKGTGELPGAAFEESIYEGYGPGGVALMLEVTTDNKNRTLSEIRNLMTKNGGSLGEAGCVSWMFAKKGYIVVDKKKVEEERLMGMALDAGAEDFQSDDESYEIMTAPSDFEKVKKALEGQKIEMSIAEVTLVPQNYVKLEGKEAEQMLRLMEALDDHDDVQKTHANFDIPDEVMEKAVAS